MSLPSMPLCLAVSVTSADSGSGHRQRDIGADGIVDRLRHDRHRIFGVHMYRHAAPRDVDIDRARLRRRTRHADLARCRDARRRFGDRQHPHFLRGAVLEEDLRHGIEHRAKPGALLRLGDRADRHRHIDGRDTGREHVPDQQRRLTLGQRTCLRRIDLDPIERHSPVGRDVIERDGHRDFSFGLRHGDAHRRPCAVGRGSDQRCRVERGG